MKIIHISAEIAPVAKEGGLGDVVYGLSRAFTSLDYDVSVVIPRYKKLKMDLIEDFKRTQSFRDGTIWEGLVDGVKVFFIEIPGLFDHDSIYGGPNEQIDFLKFSAFAYHWVCSQEKQADVLHLHDWHVAAIALLSANKYRTIGTIHNIAYQGVVKTSLLADIEVQSQDFPGIEEPEIPDYANLMKALILYSDRVNTVSPTYAWEIMNTAEGRGLQEVLRQATDRFSGILNGIDYGYWNPETDSYLAHHYSPNAIQNKKLIKNTLRDHFRLSISDRPLIGMVSRLVPQKGVELMQHALENHEKYGAQFVLSGAAYDESTIQQFKEMQDKFNSHPDVRIILGHSESLAHQIFGAADMFLIPSLFEPCGLTQLISLRYGTVPIVRHTGGLADTILDADHSDNPSETNGFSFVDPTPEEMDSALKRATHTWFSRPSKWRELQLRGMKQDFSWQQSAKQYLDLYCAV